MTTTGATARINEATGDIFGALTEACADNPNDPPDYIAGEEADLFGTGLVRYMSDPSLRQHPDCWSPAIAETRPHAARDLYPGSCTAFDAIRRAWDAVSGPAQPREPMCSTSDFTLSLEPAAVSVPIGGTGTSTVTAALRSGDQQDLTLVAAGLHGRGRPDRSRIHNGIPNTACRAAEARPVPSVAGHTRWTCRPSRPTGRGRSRWPTAAVRPPAASSPGPWRPDSAAPV